jgi:hypothetical protein
MNINQQKSITRVLMNISGYPSPSLEYRRQHFPGNLEWCDQLNEKLRKIRDLRIADYKPTSEEQWIILESLKFVLKEYDDNDYRAVMDGSREEYARLFSSLDSEWVRTVKKPENNYIIASEIWS